MTVLSHKLLKCSSCLPPRRPVDRAPACSATAPPVLCASPLCSKHVSRLHSSSGQPPAAVRKLTRVNDKLHHASCGGLLAPKLLAVIPLFRFCCSLLSAPVFCGLHLPCTAIVQVALCSQLSHYTDAVFHRGRAQVSRPRAQAAAQAAGSGAAARQEATRACAPR